MKTISSEWNETDILSYVDHTVLSQRSTKEDAIQCVKTAINTGCACAMVLPCYVKDAVDFSDGKIPIATVVGFPNGTHTATVKAFEADEACKLGAVEIDMVVNPSYIANKNWSGVLDEIKQVKKACAKHNAKLKVIIECSLLSNDEKVKATECCIKAGADWVKTSTGFGSGGATVEDIRLLSQTANGQINVKASGGVSTFEDAAALLEAGANRIGTSKLANSYVKGKL